MHCPNCGEHLVLDGDEQRCPNLNCGWPGDEDIHGLILKAKAPILEEKGNQDIWHLADGSCIVAEAEMVDCSEHCQGVAVLTSRHILKPCIRCGVEETIVTDFCGICDLLTIQPWTKS